MEFQIEPRVPGLCEMCQDLQKTKNNLLHKSVKNGHLGCVKACIAAEAGVNCEHRYNYGYRTPLVHAVSKGFDDIIEALVKAGAQITWDVMKEIKSHGGSERCVNLIFIKAGAKITDKILKEAVEKCSKECISLILEAGGDPGVMLLPALQRKRHDIIPLLLIAGAEITDQILKETGETCSEDCIKLLLETGGDPGAMLLSALQGKRHDILPLLIKGGGADVNSSHQSKAFEWALEFWVERNGVEYLKLLVEAGAKVNNSVAVQAGLIQAVGMGSVECVNLLIEAGVDVNAAHEDYSSKTALFVAATKGSTSIIKLLLKSGADVNIRDNKGSTALFTAVQSVPSKSIELLLKAGADVNSTDTDGTTVLFLSPIWFSVRRLNCYKLLLNAGVKVNVRNNRGLNALTHFLVNLKKDQNYAKCKTTNDDELEKEFVMLLFAGGEIVDESKVKKVPGYLKQSEGISLLNICRETIRKHLLQMSDVSLFYRVPKLGLPRLMTSYLLHDVTSEQEASDDH